MTERFNPAECMRLNTHTHTHTHTHTRSAIHLTAVFTVMLMLLEEEDTLQVLSTQPSSCSRDIRLHLSGLQMKTEETEGSNE